MDLPTHSTYIFKHASLVYHPSRYKHNVPSSLLIGTRRRLTCQKEAKIEGGPLKSYLDADTFAARLMVDANLAVDLNDMMRCSIYSDLQAN